MATPTPVYPSAIATNEDLKVGLNLVTTNLKVGCSATDDVLFVNDAAQFGANILVSIEKEIIAIFARNTSTPQLFVAPGGRGFDGTTAAAHPAGAKVQMLIVAYHHNVLSSEIQAIEQALGPNLGNIGTGIPGVYVSSKYAFSPQTPGGALAPGNNVINLEPVPPGVNGTDTDHWLYVDQGTGTPEPVKITGGSAIAGAPTGTVIINCANSHSGAWRIGTATAGISEAIWSMPAGSGGTVALPAATLVIHAPIRRREGMPIWVEGQGMQSTLLAIAADFPLTARGVFDWSPGDTNPVPVGGATDMTIRFIQPDSTNLASYTHWPPAIYTSGTYHSQWRNLTVIAAWDIFTIPTNTNGGSCFNIIASFFHYGFSVDMAFDSVRLENCHTATTGLTANQGTVFLSGTTGNIMFWMGRVDDLKISDCTSGTHFTLDFHPGSDGSAPFALISNLWAEGNITIQGGTSKFINLHTAGGGAGPLISHTGGILIMIASTMLYVGTASAIVSLPSVGSISAAGSYPPMFAMSNSRLDTQTGNVVQLFATTVAPFAGEYNVMLVNNLFYRTPGGAYTQPAVAVMDGPGTAVLTATGNRFAQSSGAPTSAAIQVDADIPHVITGNDGGGYNYLLPATTANLQWFANNNFAGNVHRAHNPMNITAKLAAAALVSLQTENYITPETGAANAIAGALVDAAGVAVPYAAGLRISVLLAHPLQTGANTMNLNALGAKPIKSGRNPANNLTVAYAIGAIFNAIYDGTQFLDVSQ